MKYKTIGIIGGMGSLAAVDLFNKIVINTDAACDQEHIPILIDNNTQIPDRTDFLLGLGESPLKHLIKSAEKLKNGGADFVLIACNTAHHFIAQISAAVDIEVIDGIEKTAEEAAKLGFKKVAVLGSEGFINHMDFKSYYSKVGVEVITAKEQDIVTGLIYKGIKANRHIDISDFNLLLKKLSAEGAETFVLACTELPIAFDRYGICGYQTIDPGLVLAKEAIVKAGAQTLL